ncbi:MAG: helix-turn-helix transcriptional regulator [Syntrophorhabdaceae bacterium]|nr:helix-turn-helix transcriptional regulator [Syntrophorhabdaceae bacterium]
MTPQDLKTWRKKNGYTQQGLADAIGIYQVTVARWENGTRAIPSMLALALKGLECEQKTKKEDENG